MRADRIFWGVILILFGVLFLLQNLGYLSFQFGNLWKLWPLALVYWGFSALLKNRDGRANPLLYIVQVVILSILVYFIVKPANSSNKPFHHWEEGYEWDGDEGVIPGQSKSDNKKRSHDFEVPFNSSIEQASLSIKFGAGNLTLGGTTVDELIQARANTNLGHYAFEEKINGNEATLEIEHRAGKTKWGNNSANDLNIRLHPFPRWNIEVETGASRSFIDLSDQKVESLELSGGAASMEVKLGAPIKQSKVNIQAGASGIELSLPEGTHCEIETETGLSSKDFEGFTKLSRKKYQSPNFDVNAPNQWLMKISTGVSSVSVNFY
jgi:hypothetical protein